MNNEIWLPIIGYENLYEISNFGNVKSLARECIKNGRCVNRHSGKELAKNKLSKGYLGVALCKDGICKTYKIHRLVAIHFIKNIENKSQVNHKDLNKQNNIYTNLEWATNLENMKHAFVNGAHDLRIKNQIDSGILYGKAQALKEMSKLESFTSNVPM